MLSRTRARVVVAAAGASVAAAVVLAGGDATIAWAAVAGTQSEARPAVRLVYERAGSAADCPEAGTVMDAVRARLGYDPFREPAAVVAHAALAREDDELRATISLVDGGARTGERRLVSRRSDCTELSSAVELALSIAIDPFSVGSQPPEPSAVDEPAVPAAAPRVIFVAAPGPAAAAPTFAPPKAVQATLGAVGSVGASISSALGLAASVGLRAPRWSIALEGRADLPRSRTVESGGSIRVSTMAASVAPCLHLQMLGACVLASAAALRGSGHDLDNAQRVTTSVYAVGARVMGELPGTTSLRLRVHLDVLAPLVRTTLTVGNEPAWISPPVSAAAGLDMVILLR